MGGGLPLPKPLKPQGPEYCSEVEIGQPQSINCDIRTFRMDILGQFGVIMADPPSDIHMELPYGTMADDEMHNLNVPALQTDGLIFLWVTVRAVELGHEWWMSLDNQLEGVRLVDEDLRTRFKAAYPEVEVQAPFPPGASAMEIEFISNQTRCPFESRSSAMLFAEQVAAPEVAYPSEERPMTADAEMAN